MYEANNGGFKYTIQRLCFGGGNAVWHWIVRDRSEAETATGVSTRSHTDAETQVLESIDKQRELA